MSHISNSHLLNLAAEIKDFIEYEVSCLDKRQWDEWLSLYSQDCEYWVPTWIDEDTLGGSPLTALSHIYYKNRGGLEDRVARIKTERSSALLPLPRTAHLISGVRIAAEHDANHVAASYTWMTHVFFPRNNKNAVYSGHASVQLKRDDTGWKVQRKKVELLDDYIPTMLEFYFM